MIELSDNLEINTKGKLILWDDLEVIGVEEITLVSRIKKDSFTGLTFAITLDENT